MSAVVFTTDHAVARSRHDARVAHALVAFAASRAGRVRAAQRDCPLARFAAWLVARRHASTGAVAV